jgi:hypothetical protein
MNSGILGTSNIVLMKSEFNKMIIKTIPNYFIFIIYTNLNSYEVTSIIIIINIFCNNKEINNLYLYYQFIFSTQNAQKC